MYSTPYWYHCLTGSNSNTKHLHLLLSLDTNSALKHTDRKRFSKTANISESSLQLTKKYCMGVSWTVNFNAVLASAQCCVFFSFLSEYRRLMSSLQYKPAYCSGANLVESQKIANIFANFPKFSKSFLPMKCMKNEARKSCEMYVHIHHQWPKLGIATHGGSLEPR